MRCFPMLATREASPLYRWIWDDLVATRECLRRRFEPEHAALWMELDTLGALPAAHYLFFFFLFFFPFFQTVVWVFAYDARGRHCGRLSSSQWCGCCSASFVSRWANLLADSELRCDTVRLKRKGLLTFLWEGTISGNGDAPVHRSARGRR